MTLSLLLIGFTLAAPLAEPCTCLAEADVLFEQRHIDFDREQLLADSMIIDEAITVYARALVLCPSDRQPEIAWKYLRAIVFRGYYASATDDARQSAYDRGVAVGDMLAKRYPDEAGVHLWLAINWAMWTEFHRKSDILGRGVPKKIRRHSERAAYLDSTFADGGGWRVLGGVHARTPKIPLLMGWPSKKKARAYYERAFAQFPDNLYNRRFLAEFLWDQDEKERACALLQSVVDFPRPVHGLVEDTHIKEKAREKLASWGFIDRTDSPSGAFRDTLQ